MLYEQNEYIKKHPQLHEEDSPWKIQKIKPFIDQCMQQNKNKKITLLDVGGGAGFILKEIAQYIQKKHKRKVNKYSLDLSPSILKVQKENNPDLKRAINEDICSTSLKDKEIDITLMIDVLEHVPNSQAALKELKRISCFVIFKVPLENNLIRKTYDLFTGGKLRKRAIEKFGHINVYNIRTLKKQINQNMGRIINIKFTNVFEYVNKSDVYKKEMNGMHKLLNYAASTCHKISPSFCAQIFNDFSIILVKNCEVQK